MSSPILTRLLLPAFSLPALALTVLAERHPLVTYIDVATPFLQADSTVMTDIFVADNLHLNEKGYDIWAATIRAALMQHETKYE